MPLPNTTLLGLVGFLGILGLFSKQKNISVLMLASILGISFALWMVERTTHYPSDKSIDSFATKQYVSVIGVISAEPDRRPLQTKYTVDAMKIRREDSQQDVEGKILATDRKGWPRFNIGDSVQIYGMLEKPGPVENFHYDKYLSKDDIYSVIYRGAFTRIEQEPQYRWKRILFHIKEIFEARINTMLPEPHASFMAGILTGTRRGIPDHLMQDFNTTGLTHIIAISGFNITIIITLIGSFLFWLPLKWRLIPTIVAISTFTIFVGASAAVVRAAIMGILGSIALQTGRQAHTRLSILWTVTFMLAWNPKLLWYDAGFQLSVLAVLGITELNPLVEPYLRWVPKTLEIREALQSTIAAQLSAVPLTVLLFGRLSLVSPLSNVLIAAAIPFAMLSGCIGVLVSFLWFPLGQLILYIGWALLQWVIIVATMLSTIPGASLETPNIGPAIIAMYYIVLILWIRRSTKRTFEPCAST